MRGIKAVLPVVFVVLLLGATVVGGCGGGGGGDEEAAKAAIAASLVKIEAAVADLTAKGTSGALTVAEIKATREALKPEVESVIESATQVKGLDASKIEQAWKDLDTAVTELPDTATLMEAAGVLMTKVTPLMSALADIKTAITPAK